MRPVVKRQTPRLMWHLLTTILLYSLAAVSIACAPLRGDQPTKEVNLNSELEVKQKPLQEDIDQFFRDQEHLLPKRNDTSSTSTWLPSLPTNFEELIGDVISLNQLSQIMSQLGIPITIDPASIAIMIFKTPFDWAQGLSNFRVVNVTRPMLMTMTSNDVVQKS